MPVSRKGKRLADDADLGNVVVPGQSNGQAEHRRNHVHVEVAVEGGQPAGPDHPEHGLDLSPPLELDLGEEGGARPLRPSDPNSAKDI